MQNRHPVAEVAARELSDCVADLQEIRPGPALWQLSYNVPLILVCAWYTWQADTDWGFFLGALATAFFYGRLMISTHDAIHHTWTGIGWFDEAYSRLLSWPFLWVHGTYAAIHNLHHKMNGDNIDDPERVQWTESEYQDAGLLGRFIARHQLFFNVFVLGGVGQILRTIRQGFKFACRSKGARFGLITDAIGILMTNLVIYGVAIANGFALKWLLFYLVVERVGGGLLTFRAYVEHYGLWGKQFHYFQSQIANCRNIRGNFFSRWLFNNLNYHSVHHAFAKVPFYHLPEAHRRLAEVYRSHGMDLVMEKGYLGVGYRLLHEVRLIRNHQPEVAGGDLGTEAA
jgi:fatty acid desaturase